MTRLLRISGIAVCLLLSVACSQSDREAERQRARHLEEEAKRDAERFKQEGRRAASEISGKTKSVLEEAHVRSNGAQDAENKIRTGTQHLKSDLRSAGTAMGQAAITARVKSKLAAEAGLHVATNVAVHTSGDVVTLDGVVDSADQKREAERAAASVSGVTRVVNHLQISTGP